MKATIRQNAWDNWYGYVGGRRVDPHTTDTLERRLLNVVEEMAIASGTPVPAVFILPDEPAINAFAAGWTADDAVIAVTLKIGAAGSVEIAEAKVDRADLDKLRAARLEP